VSGMNKGGAQTVAGVEFRMVQAVHSSGTSGPGGETNPPADPCGFVLTFEDGFRIYHAGDTNVFSDMALIGELYAPDLALLPIGDFYTMGPREAAKACELLAVPRVVPMHWGTFPVLTGTPEALRGELAQRRLKTEVVEMTPGESWPR
jgi:L-ascorbate metabolism protein UlaG (beta-lactamase superfamily)